jgi:beta-alanine--pyruvate transaminase
MIVISPPLIISPAQVEQIFECLRRALLVDGI